MVLLDLYNQKISKSEEQKDDVNSYNVYSKFLILFIIISSF